MPNDIIQQDTAPVQDASSIMAAIVRVASDPNFNPDTLERLYSLHERECGRQAKAQYAEALAAMQPHLPVVGRNGTIVIKKQGTQEVVQSTPYTLWEDVNEAIRPQMAEHGFALSFRIGKEADRVVVTGILSHKAGHQEESTLSLPLDTTGSKNNVQAIGSSVSYGKRYVAMAMLNITSRGEDDDGKAADPNFLISNDELDDLNALMDEVGADRTRFLNFMKIDALATLPKSRLPEAIKMLEAKRK
jgi:hypothetical protein